MRCGAVVRQYSAHRTLTVLLAVHSIRVWVAGDAAVACWLRWIAWTVVQGSSRDKHQRLHTRLDLCVLYLDTAVSTDALLVQVICVVCAPCWLLDKAALAGLVRWACSVSGWDGVGWAEH